MNSNHKYTGRFELSGPIGDGLTIVKPMLVLTGQGVYDDGSIWHDAETDCSFGRDAAPIIGDGDTPEEALADLKATLVERYRYAESGVKWHDQMELEQLRKYIGDRTAT